MHVSLCNYLSRVSDLDSLGCLCDIRTSEDHFLSEIASKECQPRDTKEVAERVCLTHFKKYSPKI